MTPAATNAVDQRVIVLSSQVAPLVTTSASLRDYSVYYNPLLALTFRSTLVNQHSFSFFLLAVTISGHRA